MFKWLIKRKIKQAVWELVQSLCRMAKNAEIDYDRENETYIVKFKKVW